jgi:hypothetical protein
MTSVRTPCLPPLTIALHVSQVQLIPVIVMAFSLDDSAKTQALRDLKVRWASILQNPINSAIDARSQDKYTVTSGERADLTVLFGVCHPLLSQEQLNRKFTEWFCVQRSSRVAKVPLTP